MIEYGRRTRRLPAPPAVVWDDLANPAVSGPRIWLNLLSDEVRPKVISSSRPDRLVWSSLWPDRPSDQILLELAEHVGGTALTFTLLAVDEPPDQSKIGHIRKRINVLLNADLRYSYGQ